MSNFSFKKLFIGLGILIGSFVAFGAILDSVGNALSLINWYITIGGTIVLILLWVFLKFFLKKHPISWGDYRITKLGFYPKCSFLGITLLLWTPPIYNSIAYTPKTELNAQTTETSIEPAVKDEKNALISTSENSNETASNILNLNKVTKSTENVNLLEQNQFITNKQINITKNKDNSTVTSKIETNKAPNLKIQSLAKARSLISQGKYDDAIEECDRILSINPKHSEALSLKKWSQKQLKILDQ